MTTRVTGPRTFVYWNRDAHIRRPVRCEFIQFLVSNIERLATWTFRLLIVSDAFHLQNFRSGLVKDLVGGFNIFWTNLQFDAAQQVGDEPIHADHIVIQQIRFDPCRLKAAFGEERFGKIAELSHRDSFVKFVNIDTRRHCDCDVEAPPRDLGLQSLMGSVAQFESPDREFFQLAFA
jgi:hypothetical protein